MNPSNAPEKPLILAGPGKWIGLACRRIASLSNKTQLGVWRIHNVVGRLLPRYRRLALGGPEGKPFFVDMTDGGFHFVMHGWGDREIRGVIRDLPKDAIAMDIGAHWGTWTRMIASQCPRGRVYAVEPSRNTFETLRKNCREIPNVSCINKAISSRTGTAWFTGGSTTAALRHLEEKEVRGSERVEAISLQELIAAEQLSRLDFLKVDVEGFECDVILPALSDLYRLRTTICFEYIPSFDGRAAKGEKGMLFAELQRAGYQVARLDLQGLQKDLRDQGDNLSNNYLAVPAR